MRNPLIRSSLLAAFMSLAAVIVAPAAYAQMPAEILTKAEFAKFQPKPSNNVKVDYVVWDEILNNMVFLTGLSTRQVAPRPEAIIGTRFVWEHTSPYRLEGNKIPFSLLNSDHVAVLQEYKHDLEDVSNQVDIASLPKREQLAYWYNLHNLTVITLIAQNYPTTKPRKLLIGPEQAGFHDAKVITVGGTKLSLRDIRENIVFANWRDPRVIYGFFHGDIGSPSIQSQAFTAENIDKLLNYNADEFVNSLRSFSRGGVSKIYKEAEPFYFKEFEKDLRDHFAHFMWENVLAEVKKTDRFEINPYDDDIADMEGGHGPRVIANVIINDKPVRDSQTRAIASFTNQVKEKTRTLLRQGKVTRGEVIVGDEEDAESSGNDGSRTTPKNDEQSSRELLN